MKAKLAKKSKSRLSAPVYLESDLVRMKNYQCELINTLMYENPYNRADGGDDSAKWSKRIIDEIKSVEGWLKKHYELFINNNKRKFQHQ